MTEELVDGELVGRCADCSIVKELRSLKEEMEWTRARLERMKRVEKAAEAYVTEVRQMEEAARAYVERLYGETSQHPRLVELSKVLREVGPSRSDDP